MADTARITHKPDTFTRHSATLRDRRAAGNHNASQRLNTLRARLRRALFHVGTVSEPGRKILWLLRRLDGTPRSEEMRYAYADLLPVLRTPQAYAFLKTSKPSHPTIDQPTSGNTLNITERNSFNNTPGNVFARLVLHLFRLVSPTSIARPETGAVVMSLVMSLMMPLNTNAAFMNQYDPAVDEINDVVDLNMTLTNDDTGAIYNSANINTIINDLFSQLSSVSGDSVADVASNCPVQIRGPPTGDIYTGWLSSGYNPVNLTHVPGDPGWDFDEWTTGNDMGITVKVPFSYLDKNNNNTLGDAEDFRIELNKTLENQVTDAFAPTTTTGANPPLSEGNFGYSYDVFGGTVPEPATGLLLGLAMTYVAGRRRRRMCTQERGKDRPTNSLRPRPTP